MKTTYKEPVVLLCPIGQASMLCASVRRITVDDTPEEWLEGE